MISGAVFYLGKASSPFLWNLKRICRFACLLINIAAWSAAKQPENTKPYLLSLQLD
jgi:hypothetical protein